MKPSKPIHHLTARHSLAVNSSTLLETLLNTLTSQDSLPLLIRGRSRPRPLPCHRKHTNVCLDGHIHKYCSQRTKMLVYRRRDELMPPPQHRQLSGRHRCSHRKKIFCCCSWHFSESILRATIGLPETTSSCRLDMTDSALIIPRAKKNYKRPNSNGT